MNQHKLTLSSLCQFISKQLLMDIHLVVGWFLLVDGFLHKKSLLREQVKYKLLPKQAFQKTLVRK